MENRDNEGIGIILIAKRHRGTDSHIQITVIGEISIFSGSFISYLNIVTEATEHLSNEE